MAGFALPRLVFSVDSRIVDRLLEEMVQGGDCVAVVRNTAQGDDGYYYWRSVNDGRGPIRPVRAKMLHWIDPKTGKDVFAKFARASAPRHIRERALPVIRQRGQEMAATWNRGGELGRPAIAEFVNQFAAKIVVPELQSRTPVVSGKLQQSYEVKPAR